MLLKNQTFEEQRLSLSTAINHSTIRKLPLIEQVDRQVDLSQARISNPESRFLAVKLGLCSVPEFYALNQNSVYLSDWTSSSFLLPGPGKSAYTDLISCCVAIGITNGQEGVLCHFLPESFQKYQKSILKHLFATVDFLREPGGHTLSAVVYAGDERIGKVLSIALGREDVKTLGLLGQKSEFEGGLAYDGTKNKFLINIYQHTASDGSPINYYEQNSSIVTEQDLIRCFDSHLEF